ncbi:MAG: GAF domain-containing protein [Myxococcota bacterium]|nr:GAF domain-containing protein [Myxococcota bacterium]MDW8360999.1 GAF domain-containing protein [Myxococcales bacterium]
MSGKRWRLVVTELGGGVALAETTVDAPNWVTALTAGRASLGEDGAVPPGASCTVGSDGKVVVHDTLSRRTYTLAPDVPQSYVSPPPQPPRVPPEPTGPASRRLPAKTVLYESVAPSRAPGPTAHAGSSPPPAPSPSPSSTPPSATSAGAPVASPAASPQPSSARPPPPAPIMPLAPAASTSPATGSSGAAGPPAAALPDPPSAAPGRRELHGHATSGASVVEAPASDADVPHELLYERSENPSPSSPLHFRERVYVVPPATPRPQLEGLLRRLLAAIRNELATQPTGKLVSIALFDHRWTGRPSRPPLATLQWKDWRGEEPEIAFPPSAAPRAAPSEIKPTTSRPPAAAHASGPRRRSSTSDTDVRLAQAFEASQDLFFLDTPRDGLEFCMRLLDELVPCEAMSGVLYDIDTDELRFTALSGPGAENRRGEAVPSGSGLFGAACRQQTPLIVADVRSDPRFDPGVDGRVGLEAHNAMYAPLYHQGRLLGVVQLLNRRTPDGFSVMDVNVVSYVAEQLGKFLHEQRVAHKSRRR